MDTSWTPPTGALEIVSSPKVARAAAVTFFLLSPRADGCRKVHREGLGAGAGLLLRGFIWAAVKELSLSYHIVDIL